MGNVRRSWDDYYLDKCVFIRDERSTCIKHPHACILVIDNREIASGYNGAMSGEQHCSIVGCLRPDSPSGTSLDKCRSFGVHDVQNALYSAARLGICTKGSTLYALESPCMACCAALVHAGIVRVVFKKVYEGYPQGPDVLRKKGIVVLHQHGFED